MTTTIDEPRHPTLPLLLLLHLRPYHAPPLTLQCSHPLVRTDRHHYKPAPHASPLAATAAGAAAAALAPFCACHTLATAANTCCGVVPGGSSAAMRERSRLTNSVYADGVAGGLRAEGVPAPATSSRSRSSPPHSSLPHRCLVTSMDLEWRP